MVTVGIFVFMTALILSKYNSFYSGTLFKNLAYDIALTIRQAQTYGISVKVAEAPIDKHFYFAYGVRFDLSSAVNAKKFSLSTYKKNGVGYDRQGDDNLRNFNIKQGAKIQSVCVGMSISSCTDLAGFTPPILDIVFKRPDPEAIFCVQSGASCNTYRYAKITLVASDNTTTHTVSVNNVGQITVD
jgi:hypothetical protein